MFKQIYAYIASGLDKNCQDNSTLSKARVIWQNMIQHDINSLMPSDTYMRQ